ncbi:hypothetical protein [Streptomyces shenzhenensis]|uniref:hypothetical protein n=1 Tax=Streptomyces shenzhenensis TaxID=943815 RepID=UPI00217F1C0F|nr:hypothetical protein [Streptomyces shenzhenensis]
MRVGGEVAVIEHRHEQDLLGDPGALAVPRQDGHRCGDPAAGTVAEHRIRCALLGVPARQDLLIVVRQQVVIGDRDVGRRRHRREDLGDLGVESECHEPPPT